MAKSITTVSIDSDALSLARARDINLSGVMSQLLKQYLEMGEKDISDIEKIRQQIGEKEAELNIFKAQLNILEKQKAELEAKKPKPVTEEELAKRRWKF
jgi:post-segregation antitoxin (ccd killing protein)